MKVFIILLCIYIIQLYIILFIDKYYIILIYTIITYIIYICDNSISFFRI